MINGAYRKWHTKEQRQWTSDQVSIDRSLLFRSSRPQGKGSSSGELALQDLHFDRVLPPKHYASRMFFAAARHADAIGQPPANVVKLPPRKRPWLGFGGLVTGGETIFDVSAIGPTNSEGLLVLTLREIDSLILAPLASASSLLRGGRTAGDSSTLMDGDTESGIDEEFADYVVAVHLEYIRNAGLHRLRYFLETAIRAIAVLLRLRKFEQVRMVLLWRKLHRCQDSSI